MKRIFCDIDGCDKTAFEKDIDMCMGYTENSQTHGKPTMIYEPFEKPIIMKRDLCKEHFKMWCKLIYNGFWGKTKK